MQRIFGSGIAASLTLVVMAASSAPAAAQLAPGIGYMVPSGGQAGKTVEVVLGGYDWTPDMEVFVHDPRIKLEIVGEPGPVIVPEPPYWFGKKARRAPYPLPREFPARLTIPADVPPGVVSYQVANANGASGVGRFVVGEFAEILEAESRTDNVAQRLPELPVTVSGQIKWVEDVDRFEFVAPQSGPLTCEVVARSYGSELSAVLEIYDAAGRMIADAADTAGRDTAITFAAEAGQTYTAAIYDLDFTGDRSLTYRLNVVPGPRVLSAVPAVGQRGQSQEVEFLGYGLATGSTALESVKRTVVFPSDPKMERWAYRLETPHGTAPAFPLYLRDEPQTVQPKGSKGNLPRIEVPLEFTGTLNEKYGEERFVLAGKAGDCWAIDAIAVGINSPLDVALAIYNAEGQEVARMDDLPDSTDARLVFIVPADGEYTVGVSDSSGHSGGPNSAYHFRIHPGGPEFTLAVPEMLSAPIGGQGKLALKVTRSPGYKEPIAVQVLGLPSGVSVPDNLEIPAGRVALTIDLEVTADAAAEAAFITVRGESVVSDAPTGAFPVVKPVRLKPGETPPEEPKVNRRTISASTGPLLLAKTIPPPFSVDAEGQDDVTKWPRGTTFPAPALIERNDGFTAEIVLEMSSKQGRHRQGITGPELKVPNGVSRVLYPVFLPEWLETTRTSRMVVNGVALVADPQGNARYSLTRQRTRMGFLPTGALLKLAADVTEFPVSQGETVSIPLTINRARELGEPLELELICPEAARDFFAAAPESVPADRTETEFTVSVDSSLPAGEYELTIRATALQKGHLPVVSEATVLITADSP